MNLFLRALLVVALVLGFVGPVSMGTVFAQTTTPAAAPTTTGTVQGTIKDNSGAPVADAKVTLSGVATKTTTTDATGAFSFANVAAGLYTLTATKAGHETATEADLTVLAGQTQTLAIVMPTITFQSLRTIASVRAVGRGTFNTTPASISVVSSQTIRDQASPQVFTLLNQTPGIVASLPQSTSNAASPGAITFPNIRGGLSFETASLIDGHPISVGQYGDYVTTFLDAYALNNIEVVKGPGADAPEVNYAIGGTVNFLTKDPTFHTSGNYLVGVNNRGGTFGDFQYSNTFNRLGVVFDYTQNDDPGQIVNYPAWYSLGGNNAVLSGATKSIGYNNGTSTIPGTQTNVYTNYGLVACCQVMNSNYFSRAELVKLRYALSPATTATFTYLGAQTDADQNANTSSQVGGTFTPGTGYSGGTLTSGAPLTITSLHPGTDHEVNNEPILEGDLRTTIGNDTLLFRYYAAGIHRLISQGGPNAQTSQTFLLNVSGTNCGNSTGCAASAANSFYGTAVPVTFYNYYNQSEDDRLTGYSAEWNHPFGRNGNDMFTLSYDGTISKTRSYSVSASLSKFNGSASSVTPSFNVGIPDGTSQNFSTVLARLRYHVTRNLQATLSNYFNTYQSTYPFACTLTGNACTYTSTGYSFATTTRTHYDPRLSLEWRPQNNLAVRLSAGSAIAPPYLNLLSARNGNVTYSTGNQYATQSVNAGTLLPETAFGYDLGASYRFKDGVTFLSGDVYRTTLYNQFISQQYLSQYTCGTIPGGCPNGAAASVPVYFSSNVNLAHARYEGVELQLQRTPDFGLGYRLQGAVMRGYAYDLPPCFYSTTVNKTTGQQDCTAFNTNIAIIPGQNFNGGTGFGLVSGQAADQFGVVGFGKIGVSNQNIPYLMGYGELNYKFHNGGMFLFGENLYGKNNSFNRPPFWIATASLREPIGHEMDMQITGYNVFNVYSGLFPTWGAGVPIPLANGQIGATQANVVGPGQWRLVFTKHLGNGQ